MKPFKRIFGLSVILGGFVALLSLLHAQETETPTQNGESLLAATNGVGAMSELEVEKEAIEMTTPLSATNAPSAGNFYSAQHAPGSEEEWPPLPGDVLQLPVWPLGDDFYLLDDLNVNYNAIQAKSLIASRGMRPMGFTPQDLISGTNLWLAITNLANNTAGLLLSNTVGDIQYEIQGKANLTDTQWISEGFVLGSELTNWTPTSITATNQPTMFLRVRSWIDSDNVGIPDWWQLEYFGYVGIDPNGDPAGDGWSNVQKFQNGMNPTNFYTPPAPQGLTVSSYNAGTSTATLNWFPSHGPVAGYTIQTPSGNFNISPNSFADSVSSLSASYRVQARYAGGNSLWSAYVSVPSNFSIFVIAGPQGSAYMVIPALPTGAKTIRITRDDLFAEGIYHDYSFDTNFDIPVSNITNSFCLIPASCVNGPLDSYGSANYEWSAQILDTNNNAISQPSYFYGGYYYPVGGESPNWLVPPYFDGRVELKQDLIFQLRAANAVTPFQLEDFIPYGGGSALVTYPPNYVYEGFYDINNYNLIYGVFPVDSPLFNIFLPFEDNYMFRNYVYSTADVDSAGNMTTGVQQESYDTNLVMELPPTYQFDLPLTNQTPITSMLSTNTSRWLCMSPLTLNFSDDNSPIGFSWQFAGNDLQWTLNSNVRNYWGLPFLSAEVYYSNLSGNQVNGVINAGNSFLTMGDDFPVYMETAQPRFQTVEYDFWNLPLSYYVTSSTNLIPGLANFSTSRTSDLLITSVGNPNFNIVGYAKLAVTNSYYSGVYGYLGQYFDQAYQIDTNGVVTTNTTGVLSPYGSFFATQPGPTALVTMPDIDTGQRGTCTVYAVGINLDANHDGNMDLSFNGKDTTSSSLPFMFWCNNNFDRAHQVDGSDNEQDDVLQGQAGIDKNDFDGNYKVSGNRQIPCARDLEDFSRLWISGVTSNLLVALPSGSTVTLNWGDVGNPNPNNPTIDLFTAADPDGGVGYLTNSTIAAQQTNIFQCPYINRLAPGGSIQLNTIQFANNWAGNHYIWCGVTNGSGQLNLTIADSNGNVLAQASQWIQIVDIKQMYERWTVGDNGNNPPANTTTNAQDGLASGASAFQYSLATINMPYVLFVHGWNMPFWEKDRYAETAFKRLYWQGYQGRFGEFRWPTYYNFLVADFQWQSFDLDNFDNSELNAWNSGAGLLNLLTSLNSQYPGQVYLMAHSMGNVVAGEALRLAGSSRVVNTYIAMQGAVSAHAYDSTTVNRIISTYPDNYAHYWTNGAACYFNGIAGAGTYVNFFNTNDYALSVNLWQLDQNNKPDTGYGYNFTFNIWQHLLVTLSYTADRYTIFAYCDPSWSYALGAQAGVGGVFTTAKQVDLKQLPYNFDGTHKFHSGEFRSDNAQRTVFWNTVLVDMKLK